MEPLSSTEPQLKTRSKNDRNHRTLTTGAQFKLFNTYSHNEIIVYVE